MDDDSDSDPDPTPGQLGVPASRTQPRIGFGRNSHAVVTTPGLKTFNMAHPLSQLNLDTMMKSEVPVTPGPTQSGALTQGRQSRIDRKSVV